MKNFLSAVSILVVIAPLAVVACGDSGGDSSGTTSGGTPSGANGVTSGGPSGGDAVTTGGQSCTSAHVCENDVCHCGDDGKGQSCTDDSKCQSECKVCM